MKNNNIDSTCTVVAQPFDISQLQSFRRLELHRCYLSIQSNRLMALPLLALPSQSRIRPHYPLRKELECRWGRKHGAGLQERSPPATPTDLRRPHVATLIDFLRFTFTGC